MAPMILAIGAEKTLTVLTKLGACQQWMLVTVHSLNLPNVKVILAKLYLFEWSQNVTSSDLSLFVSCRTVDAQIVLTFYAPISIASEKQQA